MKRGAALRGVMAAKGCDKPETLETMAREWVGGMLVAAYALEGGVQSAVCPEGRPGLSSP